MAELEIAPRFSTEVNALYRPLRAHLVVELNGAGAIERVPFSVVTWEFPVLAKYRLQAASKFQPFIEAGPSFRLSGNLNGYNPSQIGLAAGIGVEAHSKTLRIAPVIRYTHWADDPNPFSREQTRTNQVEFLVGFTF
jgi:hypothetical protein